ncbi:hypothetical protein N7541_007368 [Penicillium brevicompactum]|uniref:Uncharacterized protein n=1 Tax=Penicillium brevicompactum TaxID=5074 RepID=A0A9W9QX06_PENBR|nr:hypothetical protein N7541_007368 [Penicillium brevicompactum]
MADGGEARKTATHSVSSVCYARQVHIPFPRPRRPRTGVRNAEKDKFMRDPQWTFGWLVVVLWRLDIQIDPCEVVSRLQPLTENTVEQSHSSVFVFVIAAVA